MAAMKTAREIFLEASDRALADRVAYLDEACGSDAALRQRVEALLRANDESGAFLSEVMPAVDDDVTSTFGGDNTSSADSTASFPSKGEQAGAILAGKYRLRERIGEGGMGSVWLADQTEPVKRKVAVKLIKAGMDSKQVLARFEAERQALAMMDHPNIATVLDGGLHESRPYFVMELVKGVPITEYCDAKRLTPRERLELFVPVCLAIQHAHQKGIIHRDIKPSNVLIALYDERPVPKVIDFGVAKATGGALTESTIDTAFCGIVGTPQYMSPEQATFNNLDIDTRSDVYSLGVLLYELLAGSPPFAKKELEKRGVMEILRVVREEDPPRPSTKLSTADALPSLSANRSTEPKKLTGMLRNELDWIVMKALEKDRTRRYETANGFAADIIRYLAGEVVLAHPPSNAYRVKKFVRRHRGRVIAASLVLFALLSGIAGTTGGMIEANRARLAEAVRAEGERLAKLDADARRQEAERNLAFAKKGNDILGSVFTGLDPKAKYSTVADLRIALRDKLARAVHELDGSAIGDPLEVAAMQNTLGESLLGLGETKLAIEVFGKALATCKERLEADHPTTLQIMNNLASSYQADGKMDRALPLFEETLKLRTAKLGADHPDTLLSMSNLALGYKVVGRMDKALPLFEETLRLSTAKLGADHPTTLVSMSNLAIGYRSVGKIDKALPLMETTFKLMTAKLGADHPDTIVAMSNLALGYKSVGKMDKALPLMEETLKLSTVKLGADHPDTLAALSSLAIGYQSVGRMDQALPLLAETLKLRTAKLGADHPSTLAAMSNLAMGYQSVGKMDKALPLLEETLRLITAKLGVDHPNTITITNNLALAYQSVGKTDQALPLFERAAAGIEKRRFQQGNASSIIANTIGVYEAAGQFEKAEAWQRKWLAAVKAEAGPASPAFGAELGILGLLLIEQQKWAEAEPILRECVAIRQKSHPEDWSTFNAQSMLGGALLGRKKYADAEPLLRAGCEGMQQREKTIPKGKTWIPEAIDRLIELYTATNKPDEARKWQADRAKYPVEQAPPPRRVK